MAMLALQVLQDRQKSGKIFPTALIDYTQLRTCRIHSLNFLKYYKIDKNLEN